MKSPTHIYGTHSMDDSKLKGLSPEEKDNELLIRRYVVSVIYLNDRIISCSEDGSIRSTSMNGDVNIIAQFDLPINFISVNRDKSLLFACSDDGNVYVYETANFSQVGKLDQMDDSGIRMALFSSNGSVLVATNAGQVGVWNMTTNQVKFFDKHKVTIDAIAVHPSKNLACTNDLSGVTYVWDMDTLKVIKQLSKKKGAYVPRILQYGAHCICWTEEHLIIGTVNIEIFDQDLNLQHTIKGLPYPPMDMTIHNNILWGVSNYLKAWEMGSWKEVVAADCKPLGMSMTHNENGKLITGHRDGEVGVWEIGNIKIEEVAMKHNGSITNIISNNECMVTSANDKSIIVWDPEGKPVKRYYGVEKDLAVCCFISPNEVIIVDDSHAKVLDLASMKTTKEIKLGKYFTYEKSFLHGDELFISSVNNYPRVLNIKAWKLSEIPFRTALYEASEIVDDKIAYCGYTSVPDEFAKKFRGKRKDDNLMEAPLVLLDLRTKSVLKEFWFNENPFVGEDDDYEDLYPHDVILNKDSIVAGYSEGQVAKWNIATGEFNFSEFHCEDGINYLFKTVDGNIIPATPPSYELVLLNDELDILDGVEFEVPVMAIHYNQKNNLVIVSDDQADELIFVDANDLSLVRKEPFEGSAFNVHEFAGKYFVFGIGTYAVFDIN